MRAAPSKIALIALLIAALWTEHHGGPEYRPGAERMFRSLRQVKADLRDGSTPVITADVCRAQAEVAQWNASLSSRDSARKSAAELVAALDSYSSAAAGLRLAISPETQSACGQFLEDYQRSQSTGDQHLAAARQLLNADR